MPKKRIKKNKIDLRKKSDLALVLVFCILFIAVIILVFIAFDKSKEQRLRKEANIVIPIIEKGSENTLTIELNSLKKEEYVFKITNFRADKVAKSKLKYKIEIENANQKDIILNKNDSTDNLATKEKKFTLNNNQFPKANKKEVDTYTVKLKNPKKLTDKDKLIVKISS